MTVETELSGEPITKSGPYNGNGVTAVFDYDFQIQASDELLVTRQNADLTETVLVLTTDYTVSGVGNDAGGQITLVDPATDAPSGSKLVIQYDGDFNQSLDYSNQGRIQLGLLEDSLDKLTMHLRTLKEQVDRSVKVDAFATVDLDTLTTNISALAALESDINTVAGLSSEIATLNGLSSEITTLNGLSSEIASLAAITADITAVAAGISDVSTLAGLSSQITTLAAISADITALATAVGGTLNGVWNFSSTAYLGIPTGTTAQRGSPGALRVIRYNSTLAQFEGWNGVAWFSLGSVLDLSSLSQSIGFDADDTYDIGTPSAAPAEVHAHVGRIGEVSDLTGTKPATLTGQWAARSRWVYDQAGPTVIASENVTSITDNSAGNFQVNFTNAFADTNFSHLGQQSLDGLTASTDQRRVVVGQDRQTGSVHALVVSVSLAYTDQETAGICVGELA